MTPTKGRTVFFVLKSGITRPATVIEADHELVTLCVFMLPAESLHEATFQPRVRYSPLGTPGTWHWPDRVIPPVAEERSAS